MPVYTYEIIETYAHNPQAFTEGLIYQGGVLYESTGSWPKGVLSSVRKIDLETGEILEKQELPVKYFGEGLTMWKNKLIQLTWSDKVFVYDSETLEKLDEETQEVKKCIIQLQ